MKNVALIITSVVSIVASIYVMGWLFLPVLGAAYATAELLRRMLKITSFKGGFILGGLTTSVAIITMFGLPGLYLVLFNMSTAAVSYALKKDDLQLIYALNH